VPVRDEHDRAHARRVLYPDGTSPYIARPLERRHDRIIYMDSHQDLPLETRPIEASRGSKVTRWHHDGPANRQANSPPTLQRTLEPASHMRTVTGDPFIRQDSKVDRAVHVPSTLSNRPDLVRTSRLTSNVGFDRVPEVARAVHDPQGDALIPNRHPSNIYRRLESPEFRHLVLQDGSPLRAPTQHGSHGYARLADRPPRPQVPQAIPQARNPPQYDDRVLW
jgi:hypothetical protein